MNARKQDHRQHDVGGSRQGFEGTSGGMSRQRRHALEAGALRRASLQMSLFGSLPRSGPSSPYSGSAAGKGRPLSMVDPGLRRGGRHRAENPHLAKAKRIARQMRRMPDHSPEETRAGLAICRQLKAFLRD